jgi:hypothetical protein
VADYDNDGDLDILADSGFGSLFVHRNDGNFSFTNAFTSDNLGATPYAVAWADINNDSYLDALALSGNISTEGIYLFLNNGGTGFSKTAYIPRPTYKTVIEPADFDGDGDTDILAAGYFSSSEVFASLESDFGTTNTAPAPPAVFSSVAASSGAVEFRWDAGSETAGDEAGFSPNSLYYAVRIATTTPVSSAASWVVSGEYGSPLLGNYLRPKVSNGQLGVKLKVPGEMTYYWQVRTVDAGFSASSWSVEQSTFVIIPPGAVVNLSAANQGYGALQLSWSAPGDDYDRGTLASGSQYSVLYTTNSSFNSWSPTNALPADVYRVSIATSGVNSGETQRYMLSGLTPGSTYFLRLFTADEASNWSPLSNAATAYVTAQLVLPPSFLTASALPGQVVLNWIAPASPPAPFLDHYEVSFSSLSPSGPFAALGAVPGNTVSFLHSNLANYTTYYYQIVTVDTAGILSAPASIYAVTPDTAPPLAVTDLAASIGQGAGEVVLTWTFPGDDEARSLTTGSFFAIQYTTDAASVVWSTSSAQVVLSTSSVAAGAAQRGVLTGLTQAVPYHFRLWSADAGLNWSPPSNVSTSASRGAPPVLLSISPTDGELGVPRSAPLVFRFDKVVQRDSLAAALRVMKRKDNLANEMNVTVDGILTPSASADTYQFVPSAPFSGNSVYVVTLASGVLDLQGNVLAQSARARFITLFDPVVFNKFTTRDEAFQGLFALGEGADLDIPAGAFDSDGYIVASTIPTSSPLIAAATNKLVRNTGDPLRTPLEGSLVDLKAFDVSRQIKTSPFAVPVTVSIAFKDDNDDGIVDGSEPPVRTKTLGIYWLDEAKSVWHRLPSSRVDAAIKRVTAETPHFTKFALMGQLDTDLSSAYAYPVPYRMSLGHRDITFAGLGQDTRIQIFTVTGEKVVELESSLNDGQLVWKVINSAGEDVASGVYIYLMESGENKKTGKLVIIR